jgi:hypothetical protein
MSLWRQRPKWKVLRQTSSVKIVARVAGRGHGHGPSGGRPHREHRLPAPYPTRDLGAPAQTGGDCQRPEPPQPYSESSGPSGVVVLPRARPHRRRRRHADCRGASADAKMNRLPKYLTQDEVRQFFAVISSRRDRALFAVIYRYGLRVDEATMLIRRLKNGLGGEKPLWRHTAKLLRAYFRVRKDVGPHLFTGRGSAEEAPGPKTLHPIRRRQDVVGRPVSLSRHIVSALCPLTASAERQRS